MPLEIIAFEDKHLEDAAALVVAEYHCLRAEVPALPERYEDIDVIAPMLRGPISRTPAVAAISGGRLVGFLSGFLVPDLWGKRGIYCPEWAHSAAGQTRRIYQEMYTRLSASWVANGCFTHALGMLASDREGIDALNWLGFGHVGGDAVRELEPVKGPVSDVEVRRATWADLDEIMSLVVGLNHHMAAPPTFLAFTHPPDRDSYSDQAADPATSLLLAFRGGEAVGYMRFGPASTNACGIIVDAGTSSNTGAFVREDARGSGVGAALLNRGLEWARSRGYARCAVDFETANVLAARFWTRHFQPVAYGLARRVDERVAWASSGRDTSEMW